MTMGFDREDVQDFRDWAAIYSFMADRRSATLRPPDPPHFSALLFSAEESVFPIGLES